MFVTPERLRVFQDFLMSKIPILTTALAEALASIALIAQTFATPNTSLEASLPLDKEVDQRVEQLTVFLEKYNSPMVNQAETFVVVADKYNLDWKFLPAIAGIESLFGNHVLENSYNPFGWGGGYIYFDSWGESIETVGYELSKRFGENFRTPEVIAPTYCPPNYVKWTSGVNYFMDQLETNAVVLEL